jgi:hypothetical protein
VGDYALKDNFIFENGIREKHPFYFCYGSFISIEVIKMIFTMIAGINLYHFLACSIKKRIGLAKIKI